MEIWLECIPGARYTRIKNITHGRAGAALLALQLGKVAKWKQNPKKMPVIFGQSALLKHSLVAKVIQTNSIAELPTADKDS